MFPHVKLFTSGVSLHDEVDDTIGSPQRSYHFKNPDDKVQLSSGKSRGTTISKKYASEFDHEAFVDNLKYSSNIAALNMRERGKEVWLEHGNIEAKEIPLLSAPKKDEKIGSQKSSIEKIFQLGESKSAKMVSTPSNSHINTKFQYEHECDEKLPKVRSVYGSKQVECKTKDNEKVTSVQFKTFEDSFKVEQSSPRNIESEKLSRLNSLKRRIKASKTAIIGGNNVLKSDNSYVPTVQDDSDAKARKGTSIEGNGNYDTDVKLSSSTTSGNKPTSPNIEKMSPTALKFGTTNSITNDIYSPAIKNKSEGTSCDSKSADEIENDSVGVKSSMSTSSSIKTAISPTGIMKKVL